MNACRNCTRSSRPAIARKSSQVSTPTGLTSVLPCRRRNSPPRDRKSTRLNSSHANISYAVFCLKNKQHTYSWQLVYRLHELNVHFDQCHTHSVKNNWTYSAISVSVTNS